MVQNYATILLVGLLALSTTIDAKPSARLRGKHFEALEELARNPRIDAAIRGKTLKEFGIEERDNRDDPARRDLQTDDEMTLRYFSVRTIQLSFDVP